MSTVFIAAQAALVENLDIEKLLTCNGFIKEEIRSLHEVGKLSDVRFGLLSEVLHQLTDLVYTKAGGIVVSVVTRQEQKIVEDCRKALSSYTHTYKDKLAEKDRKIKELEAELDQYKKETTLFSTWIREDRIADTVRAE